MLNIRDAAIQKYGPEMGMRRFKTLRVHEYLAPWAGYALYDGRVKLWPQEDVERWERVYNYNRAEYYRDLLADPRQHVRIGVRAKLQDLARRGKLPDMFVEVLREVREKEAV